MSTQEIPAKKTKFAANKTKTETAEAAQTENRKQKSDENDDPHTYLQI